MTPLKRRCDRMQRAWKTWESLTPADIGILDAALELCEHDGDDLAVEIVTFAIESERVIDDNDPTTAEELAYYVVHKLRRKL